MITKIIIWASLKIPLFYQMTAYVSVWLKKNLLPLLVHYVDIIFYGDWRCVCTDFGVFCLYIHVLTTVSVNVKWFVLYYFPWIIDVKIVYLRIHILDFIWIITMKVNVKLIRLMIVTSGMLKIFVLFDTGQRWMFYINLWH